MPRPRKQKPISESLGPEVMEHIAAATQEAIASQKVKAPEVGDVIQFKTHNHPKTANLGIVAKVDGALLSCYTPMRRGHPEPWKCSVNDVHVIGPAFLKFKGRLPDDGTADNSLDKI